MGSWDACCGLSKLPIHYDDPVVDVLLGEVAPFRREGFLCYSNDLWAPLTIQTYGRYDDYGRIETETGWHVDYVEQMFRSHAVPLELGENQYHDVAINPAMLDYRRIEEAVHEGRLYVKLPGWLRAVRPLENNVEHAIGVRVSRMMIHRFVFDELVSWPVNSLFHGIYGLNDLIEAGKQIRHMDKIDLLLERSDNLFMVGFRRNESGDYYVPHRLQNYLEYLTSDAITDEQALPVITDLAKFMLLRVQMQAMNFLWTPQIGSQNWSYDMLSKFYRLCDSHAQQKLHEDD